MDNLLLTLHDCDVADISQIAGPYLRNHLRLRDRRQDGLCVRASSGDPNSRYGHDIDFRAGDVGELDFSAPEWRRVDAFFGIVMLLEETLDKRAMEKAALDLASYAPLEEVIYLHTYENPAAMEGVNVRFPNLKALTFHVISLSAALRIQT